MYKTTEFTKDWYSTGQAAKYLALHPKTIYKWVRENRIDHIRSETNRVLISRETLISLLEERGQIVPERQKKDVIYARVPTYNDKDKGRLDQQIVEVLEKASLWGLKEPVIIKDVASGLDCDRKGMKKLMNLAEDEEIGRIFVLSTDRLTRFGYVFLEELFNSKGVEVCPISDTPVSSSRVELVRDLTNLTENLMGYIGELNATEKERFSKLMGLGTRLEKVHVQ